MHHLLHSNPSFNKVSQEVHKKQEMTRSYRDPYGEYTRYQMLLWEFSEA